MPRSIQMLLKRLGRFMNRIYYDKGGSVPFVIGFLVIGVALTLTMTMLPLRYVACYAIAAIAALRLGWTLLGYDERQDT